jgi:hypothetical protein
MVTFLHLGSQHRHLTDLWEKPFIALPQTIVSGAD